MHEGFPFITRNNASISPSDASDTSDEADSNNGSAPTRKRRKRQSVIDNEFRTQILQIFRDLGSRHSNSATDTQRPIDGMKKEVKRTIDGANKKLKQTINEINKEMEPMNDRIPVLNDNINLQLTAIMDLLLQQNAQP